MNVSIKKFNVAMEIKTKGVELEVRNPADAHQGDLILTKTKLIWCEGKTRPRNGKKVTWKRFIEWMETQ